MRTSLIGLGILTLAACTKSEPQNSPAPAPAAAAPTAPAAEEATPAKSPAQVTCDKYKDAVATALTIEVTKVNPQKIANYPLRCIYQNAKLPVAIEFRPDEKLDVSRKEMSSGGGSKASDSPVLGKNGFRANFGGVNYVYGMKGTTMIKLGSGGWEYGPLEVLMQKVVAID
jgi:hypothetical protein